MTKTRILTLVRHAKSSWGDAGMQDIDRPLNPRGLRDAPRMAAWLAQQIAPPDLILSSPAQRARSTAEAMAQAFGLEAKNIRIEDWIYYRGAQAWLEGVQSLEDRLESVLLVGHNPTISDFGSRLLHSDSLSFATCAVCTLELPAESWALVSNEPAEMRFYQSPKGLD